MEVLFRLMEFQKGGNWHIEVCDEGCRNKGRRKEKSF